jgi:hypothetical protein
MTDSPKRTNPAAPPSLPHSAASQKSAQAVRRAGYTLNTWRRSLRGPAGGLRGLGGRFFETMPGGIDLSISSAVASRPRLGGGRRVSGGVKPNDSARSPMNQSRMLTGFGLRS